MMTIKSTSTFLFLLVGSAAAVRCNLCFHSSNQFDTVPPQNQGKTVRTTQGLWNCGGMHDAGLNGIFTDLNDCRQMATEFAPTCCNLPSRRDEELDAEEDTVSSSTNEQEDRDLQTVNGHRCNLCGAGGSVPAANQGKFVRTSMGSQPCGAFFQAALTGDIFRSQNQCNAIASEFASCCSASGRRDEEMQEEELNRSLASEEDTTPAASATSNQEDRDLQTNSGHSCNLCGAGGSVPAANQRKTVRMSTMGTQPCGQFFQAALTGDVIRSQNMCNAIAREFSSCCSSNTRALRGAN